MFEFSKLDEHERDPFREDDLKARKRREVRRYFDDNERPLNINQAGIDFLYCDEDPENLTLELLIFKVFLTITCT